MGLIYHFRLDRTSIVPHLACAEAQSDITESLIKCVDAVKGYLDSFLSLQCPSDRLPFEEWLRLIVAFFVLYKLSVKLPEVPAWNFECARRIIDLEAYLVTVISRLLTARSENAQLDAQAGENLYAVLPEILKSAKESYIATRDRPDHYGNTDRVHIDLSQSRQPHNMGSSNHRLRTPGIVRCPITSHWASLADAEDWRDKVHGLVLPRSASADVQQLEDDRMWSEILARDLAS